MNIGIITIFSIQNYGSALQAYALQRYVDSLPGCRAELINYLYPNEYHKEANVEGIRKLRGFCEFILTRMMWRFRERDSRFKLFSLKFHRLGEAYYKSVTDIEANPPMYDVYLTGSDQVWNIKSLKNDPVMYCSFAPKNARKIAFGASMVVDQIPEQYVDSIRHRLSSYSYIGIREHSGVEVVKSLGLPMDIKVETTCDPTLLLSAKQYDEVIACSKLKIKGKYILIYFLGYAFNPHPAFEQVVDKIQKQFNLPVIVIGARKINYNGKYRFFGHIGPADFVALVNGASYVITSSFHGLMFSLIFRCPFTVIVPSREENDTRMIDVLRRIGLDNRAVVGNRPLTGSLFSDNPYTAQIEENINLYINNSKNFLCESLSVENLNVKD